MDEHFLILLGLFPPGLLGASTRLHLNKNRRPCTGTCPEAGKAVTAGHGEESWGKVLPSVLLFF